MVQRHLFLHVSLFPMEHGNLCTRVVQGVVKEVQKSCRAKRFVGTFKYIDGSLSVSHIGLMLGVPNELAKAY